MRFLNRKTAVVAAVLAGILAISGVAYAYFTTTGAGSGTGTVGTDTALALHGTVDTTLYPGTNSVVHFTVDNPSPGHEQLNTIHLVNVTTTNVGCVVADFTMPDVVSGQDFPNGNGQAVTATGTISMANTNVSQDACKNAPLTLHLTSN